MNNPANIQEASPNLNNYQYQFTRHLASCNNIDYGKKSLRNLFAVSKDFEPSATIYGIVRTIEFSNRAQNSPAYKFNHIYVSNLIRTWITAVLLYGTHNPNELTLYVSPFLKEKHEGFLRGNFPKEIYHTAAKFQKFLSTIRTLCNGPLTEKQEKELYNLGFPKDYYKQLPQKITLVLPPSSKGLKQQIVFNKTPEGPQGYAMESDICIMEDTSGPNTNENGFKTTGNLQDFMEWFESDNNYHGKKVDENALVHIVTHSQIMQQYLRDKFNFDIDKNNDYKSVRKSNTWRFKTRKNVNPESGEYVNMTQNGLETNQKVPLLVEGVLLNKDYAKDLETIFENISLCGKTGSVLSLCGNRSTPKLGLRNQGPLVQGGKFTRKNKKIKTRRKNKKSKKNVKKTSQ